MLLIATPTKTLSIKGICDRIAIDLVFGLPLTEEGFLSVMVISEYLTKYPYVETIKSKKAVIFLSLLVGFYSSVRILKSYSRLEGFGSKQLGFLYNFIGTRGPNPKPNI
ncbi:hypothetical protein BpHYR1_042580 [Brachionus plicatilis]|uniref:Uncharacterized protein n=1 Tax=Brachionus plicatilis TaxID=10195 RepID=A0A3M7QRH9_BRAPC|nr:hypothetical protein BpHYR1_042580 [Brachionus plicatilis]